MTSQLSKSVKLEILDCMNKILSDYPNDYSSSNPSLILQNNNNVSLYLGDANDATHLERLKQLNIKNILNCASNDISFSYPKSFNVYSFNALDYFEYKLLDNHLMESTKFLNSVENGNILVHCLAGVNRSATIVIAYLMVSQNMNLLDCIKYVSNRRPWILTNDGFKLQLIDFAYKNNKLGNWRKYQKSLSESIKLEILDCINDILAKYPNTSFDSNPSLILTNKNNISLYLGDSDDASNLSKLNELNVKNILNCASFHVSYSYPKSFNVCCFGALDYFGYKLFDKHLTESMKYLNSVMNSSNSNGNVLVHCVSGMNRSVAIVMAYLILYENINLLDGIEHISKRRPWILSNKGFKLQLIDLAYKNGKLGNWKKLKRLNKSKL